MLCARLSAMDLLQALLNVSFALQQHGLQFSQLGRIQTGTHETPPALTATH